MPHTDEELKKALKAFKKRLKLTRLDDESKLGHSPLTGNKGKVVSIQAPASSNGAADPSCAPGTNTTPAPRPTPSSSRSCAATPATGPWTAAGPAPSCSPCPAGPAKTTSRGPPAKRWSSLSPPPSPPRPDPGRPERTGRSTATENGSRSPRSPTDLNSRRRTCHDRPLRPGPTTWPYGLPAPGPMTTLPRSQDETPVHAPCSELMANPKSYPQNSRTPNSCSPPGHLPAPASATPSAAGPTTALAQKRW